MKKKLDDNGEEIEGMNIPLSVGPKRQGEDKNGVSCSIYDIIVNPKVLRDILDDITGKHKDFICALAIQSIEQKYNENLDKRYKLPKLKYMSDKSSLGNNNDDDNNVNNGKYQVATQYIQDRKGIPKIEEVSDRRNTSTSSNKNIKKADNTNKTNVPVRIVEDKPLDHTMYWLYSNSEKKSMDISASSTYVEPLTIADEGVDVILFCCNFDSNLLVNPGLNAFEIDISAFKIQVSSIFLLSLCHGITYPMTPMTS
jgi:hypothetical protein